MRALVVSDVHGNLQALQAVLSAAGSFDELWNLGDIVGYGANPNEVINTIRALARINVRGNHDRVCSGLSQLGGLQSCRCRSRCLDASSPYSRTTSNGCAPFRKAPFSRRSALSAPTARR